MIDFTLKELSNFIHICKLGGFRTAALAIGITEGALSVSIKSLEKRLGVVLFNRKSGKKGKSSPTQTGERIYPLAQEIVALCNKNGIKRISHCSTLLDVVRTGSFREAAEKNFLSSASLSGHMRRMAKDVGVQILLPRRAELSDEGIPVYHDAVRIVNLCEQTKQACHSQWGFVRRAPMFSMLRAA